VSPGTRSGPGELLGDLEAAGPGDALGLSPQSISAVVTEFENYSPECWHTSKAPVVRILADTLRLACDE